METPKKRRSSERSCPPTALSLPVGPNGISARSVTKRQLIKMLHRSPSGRKAGEERRALAKNSHQPVFPQPGKKRRIGAEYAIETDPLARSGLPISDKATISFALAVRPSIMAFHCSAQIAGSRQKT